MSNANALATKGVLGDAVALITQGVLDASATPGPGVAPVFICLHGELKPVQSIGGELKKC